MTHVVEVILNDDFRNAIQKQYPESGLAFKPSDDSIWVNVGAICWQSDAWEAVRSVRLLIRHSLGSRGLQL
jgi:hypothetical protein